MKKLLKLSSKFSLKNKWNVTSTENYVIGEMNSSPENKINDLFLDDFHSFMDTIDSEYPKLPLIITSANEGIFSSGIDRTKLENISENPREVLSEMNNLFERLYLAKRPTVAAINGNAIAGGFILALATDFRFIHPKYYMETVAGSVGLPHPSSVYHIIKYEIPFYKKFILTGDKIDGNTAIRERISLKFIKSPLEDAIDFVNSFKNIDSFINSKIALKSDFYHFKENEGKIIDENYIAAASEVKIDCDADGKCHPLL